ncbi:MAG: electron transfer flavoprotein subunit beta/FixA family protein [Bdellovibrionota bacterium]
MKVFVCIKQVPDTEAKLKILPDQSGVDGAGIKWVMNPYDEFAVEEAIKFREANAGAQVLVLTLGPKPRAAEVLRTALAMGADEGLLINAPENLDNFSTARALAEVIKQEGGAHLIFTGKVAIDDNSSSVSQMLAEFLSLPHATVVSKFSKGTDGFVVERDVEGGAKELIQLSGASVVAANKGLNMPRYASLPGIMKAKKKTLKEIEFSSLGVSSAEQKIKFTTLTLPPEKPPAKLIPGDSSAQVSTLVQLLRDEAKVL